MCMKANINKKIIYYILSSFPTVKIE